MAWISQAEYAKKRKVDPSRISRLKKQGRLDGATRQKGKRTEIDEEKADAILDANIDQSWSDQVKLNSPTDGATGGRENGGSDSALGTAEVKGPDYVIKMYKATKLKLEIDIIAGKYVLASEVEAAAFNRARATRDAMMAMPERLAARLAAETDPIKIMQILQGEIIQSLEELSR